MNELQWLAEAGDMEGCPQHGMPLSKALQGGVKFGFIERRLNAVTEHVMVHRRERIQFVPEEHAFLQCRDRVGVFGVRRKLGPIFRRDEAKGLGLLWRRAKFLVLGTSSQLRDGWALENLLQGEVQAGPLGA